MEDFLFEDNLMESMEILSFEERDINQIIRENAHALLDAEMDMEEILCESGIELVEEGFVGNVMDKIKAIFNKIKELIQRFIDWVKSLFKKKEQAAQSTSNSSNTGSSNSSTSGSRNSSNTGSSNSSNTGSSNSSNTGSSNSYSSGSRNSYSSGNGPRLNGGSRNSYSSGNAPRLNSGGSYSEEKNTNEYSDVTLKLLKSDKLKSNSDTLLNELSSLINKPYGSKERNEELTEVKNSSENSFKSFENKIDSCWETVTADRIVSIKNNKFQYESVNKDILGILENCKKEVHDLESSVESNVKNYKGSNVEIYVSISQIIIGYVQRHLTVLKTLYNEDMTNRQRAFIEVRKNKKKNA